MPEGPEISFMAYEFNKKFKNTTLTHIRILSGRYMRHPHPLKLDELNKNLPSKIEGIFNKGKFIYLKLKDNYDVGIKLNYGHLVTHDGKHSNIEFNTSKDSFYIEDMRNFGTLTILDDSQLEKELLKIGPDLIHENVSFEEYNEVLNKHPKLKIGQYLIEQKYFSGVGNYIRAEVCYEAKISPFRLVKDLTLDERKNLFKQLIKVIHKAYELLLKDKKYHMKVYKKKETPLGEKVISQRLEKNRNIYWVPSVQK